MPHLFKIIFFITLASATVEATDIPNLLSFEENVLDGVSYDFRPAFSNRADRENYNFRPDFSNLEELTCTQDFHITSTTENYGFACFATDFCYTFARCIYNAALNLAAGLIVAKIYKEALNIYFEPCNGPEKIISPKIPEVEVEAEDFHAYKPENRAQKIAYADLLKAEEKAIKEKEIIENGRNELIDVLTQEYNTFCEANVTEEDVNELKVKLSGILRQYDSIAVQKMEQIKENLTEKYNKYTNVCKESETVEKSWAAKKTDYAKWIIGFLVIFLGFCFALFILRKKRSKFAG